MWHLLANPIVWEVSRLGLDLAFGLYRKRVRLLRDWGLVQNAPSVLDIGCGIGQYARVSAGHFLGVDMSEPYIAYARRRHRRPNQTFRCVNATALLEERAAFDLVLMVDFLHHLTDEECLSVLATAARLAKQHVVSFEPVTFQPHPLGRWIVEHDRGHYVRPLDALTQFYPQAGLTIVKNEPLWLGPIHTRAILCRPNHSITTGNLYTGL